ncbi:FHA domain-containing protein [Kutzneria sp. 744]|nr:FHA domain-containing protein [Kutzneria sp. 744]
MTRQCQLGGELVGDDVLFCDEDLCPTFELAAPSGAPRETPASSGGEAVERRPWGTDVCWRCGTSSPGTGATNCANVSCGRSLTAPAVHIRFADGEVALDRDDRTELGRLGPHSRVFVSRGTVSRRHAVVVVNDGRVTVQALPTPNGTFVNGDEMAAESHRPLRDGDRLRFGSDVEGEVALYALQPRS